MEIEILCNSLRNKYGIDISNYAPASLERRVYRFMNLYHINGIRDLESKIINDTLYYDLFINEITVNTTEMFRDPECWKEIKQVVFPTLKDLPSIRIWHAGCSSGEEVYSMAIWLKEYGLYDKAKIVATDLSKHILNKAKLGYYPLKTFQLNQDNYKLAGGEYMLERYMDFQDNTYKFNSNLTNNISFIKHDLSLGNAFSKFDLILCRNVMIYFNKNLQERVFELFRGSLFKKGYVIIGKKESMAYYSNVSHFQELNSNERIFRLK